MKQLFSSIPFNNLFLTAFIYPRFPLTSFGQETAIRATHIIQRKTGISVSYNMPGIRADPFADVCNLEEHELPRTVTACLLSLCLATLRKGRRNKGN